MTVLRSISSYVETGGVTTLYVKFVLIFFSCQNKSVVYKLEKDSATFEEKKKTVLLLKKPVLLLTNLNENLL